MKRLIALLALTVFAGLGETASAQQASSSDVRLNVARFWRGEGRTLLDGVIGMPASSSNRAVQLTVRDSAGRVLHTENWTDSAQSNAAALAAANAELTNKLQVVLNPGLYAVVVQGRTAARVDSAVSWVRGFSEAPLMSDVVLSSQMRVLRENEQPSPAEMQRGRYAVQRATRVTVLPSEPRLWYYVELYRHGADSVASLEFRVLPKGVDSALVRVTRNVAVGARGTVDAAALVVQGLPPGDYRLLTKATQGSRSEQRESVFTMGSFETAPVTVAAPGAGMGEGSLLERYFSASAASDAAVSELVEALMVAPPSEGVSSEISAMDTDAKRRFLARYFSRIPDPKPETPGHELLEEFSERVRYVMRQYSEHRGRSGPRTDRGRIYLRYGQPDAQQTLPTTGRGGVEIWKYTGRRTLKFAFLDETGFQNFNLVYTTDPNYQSMSDWQERVRDEEAIRLIMSF